MINLRIKNALPLHSNIREKAVLDAKSAILNACSPVAIYLFGSATTEHFHEDSDIDCLVIFETEIEVRRSWKLYSKIRSQTNRPFDFVVMSSLEFERKRDLGGIAFIAWTEGRQIYPE